MISFTLNGKSVEVDVEAEMPLLWVIREELGLRGTKYGCGMALCGACTVLIDGQATRSCVLPVSAVANREVRTIEALGTPDAPHPVQMAWLKFQVPQCGYCQSGMQLSAAALLEQNPRPTDADIDAAVTNVCRCGCYMRIREAIHAVAAELPSPPLEVPDEVAPSEAVEDAEESP